MSSTQTRRDPYQEVTDRILASLEAGTKPWIRPWDPGKAGGPQAPFNPTTGRWYRGINVLILGMDLRAFTTADPRWMTYQQAGEAGWQVRKGEKSTTIFFFKPLEIEDEAAEDGTRTIPLMRSYAVFHASQLDGIPAYVPPTVEEAPWQRPEAADIILRNSGAIVRTGGDRAFYSPSADSSSFPRNRPSPVRINGRQPPYTSSGTGRVTQPDLRVTFPAGSVPAPTRRRSFARNWRPCSSAPRLDCQPTSPTMPATSPAGSGA